MLKQELCEKLLRELAILTSLGVTRLWLMAPPFVPSDATVSVVPREGTGGGDATGTGDAPGGAPGGESMASAMMETQHRGCGEEKPFQ